MLRRLEVFYAAFDGDPDSRISALWQTRAMSGEYKNLKPRIQELLEAYYLRNLLRKLKLAQEVNVKHELKQYIKD